MTTRTDRIQVIFEVGGDGKLKATLGDIGKDGQKAAEGLDKASSSHARLISAAKAGAAVLGSTLVAALSLVIKNTMDAEKVDAQLEARLKSTAGAAGMTKQALDDLATATARKTTFDDEAVKSAEAMLLTFTKIHADVFPKAIDAITDMATAMGTDLETASIQVGKALNDPIQGVSALTRVGVQFSDAQKDVIENLVETGRTAEAQGVILRELETQFGGAAEAARGTLSGALVALKNTLMDLTEGSGGSLAGTTGAVNELIDTLNDPGVKAGADAVVSGLLSIVNAAVQATAWLGNATGALREYYGESSKKSTVMLQNQRTELETDLFAAQRRSGQGLSDANDPISKLLFGRQSGKDADVARLQGEIAKIDALLLKRRVDAASASPAAGPKFSPEYERASLNFNPNGGRASGGATGGGVAGRGTRASSSAPRAMPDFYRDTVEDIQREIEAAARLDDEWNKLAATLSGPLASAEYEHQQNLLEIEQLGRQAGASADAVATAKAQETARYREQREEIEASLDPMGQLLQAYEMEANLIGLGNAERAMANALRREGIDLASEEAQAYMASARAVDDTARAHADAMGYVDDLKGVSKNLLMDMSKDAAGTFKNIGDYWESLVDQILSRWYDAGLDGLFSGQGFSGFSGGFGGGGGSSGGGWLSMLGSLFGGGGNSGFAASANGVSGADFASIFGEGAFGLAQGGPANKGQLYEVAEYNKPEVFRANGRTWLIPGSNGYVQPMGDGSTGGMGGGGDRFHMPVVINVRGDDRARTADQVADRLDRRTSRVKRNR